MARALLLTDAATTRVVLPSSLLVGRHWRCDVRLELPAVPLHWLEIRWTGDVWAWRALGSVERTVGRGRTLPAGWRSLDVDAQVRLGNTGVAVVMVDDAPPAVTLQDLDDGSWLDGDARFDVVALTGDGPRLRGADGEPAGPTLPDGAMVTLDGRRWRVHRPDPVVFTLGGSLSLTAADLAVDFDLQALTARFSGAQGEVSLQGALVRPLAVYAAAMSGGPCTREGGWLSNVDAENGLAALGVESTGRPERMNWDRHRLRSALTELGITGLDDLFERSRIDGRWVHRLGVQPTVSGLDGTLWTQRGDDA